MDASVSGIWREDRCSFEAGFFALDDHKGICRQLVICRWSIAGDRQSRLFVCGNPHSLVRNPQPDYEEVVLMNDCWYEEAVGLDD